MDLSSACSVSWVGNRVLNTVGWRYMIFLREVEFFRWENDSTHSSSCSGPGHQWPCTSSKGKGFLRISFLLWGHAGVIVRISLMKASIYGGDESLWQAPEWWLEGWLNSELQFVTFKKQLGDLGQKRWTRIWEPWGLILVLASLVLWPWPFFLSLSSLRGKWEQCWERLEERCTSLVSDLAPGNLRALAESCHLAPPPGCSVSSHVPGLDQPLSDAV